jgi:light-regulated signal transduction histidine kinase (bacteriophytochrome)
VHAFPYVEDLKVKQPEPDLEACAREPIHIPGAIQPHGALLVLHPQDLTVLQASANASDFFGTDVARQGPAPAYLAQVLPEIAAWYASETPVLQTVLGEGELHLTAHRSGGLIVIEIERSPIQPLQDLFSRLRGFVEVLSRHSDSDGSLGATATFIHELTGFDRVLVYRFDRDWNGHVVAEAGNGNLPSYLDLRFPAGDIPAQARALYAANRVRIISDVDYRPVPIEPASAPGTMAPLDLSGAQLRSVSPLHLEYMRNMGTAASMSVSIMVEDDLWGLVACHSARPHSVPVTIRDACDFIVQSLGMRIAAQANGEDAASRVALARISARLLSAMTSEASWLDGLVRAPDDLLAQVAASGAAIVTSDRYLSVGSTPSEAHVRSIVSWLSGRGDEEIVSTHSLAAEFAAAEAFAGSASGILAIRISELFPNWLIWFRPEVISTVQWGGNPHKVVQEAGRIHPRKSFDAWREQVRLNAPAWTEAELSAARDLRRAIVGIVLRNAEEMAQLSSELQRSNKELEAFSYSVSHDLRAPFRHIVGFSQLLRERESGLDAKSQHYLQHISESAVAAGKLVDDLLAFSQLGRTAILRKNVDMNKLVAEVVKSVLYEAEGRDIIWEIADLPVAWGDATLLRQVWFNLIENSVKYTRPRSPAVITISGWSEADATVFRVSDNGVGLDMTYAGKLFGVFQRLQRVEDFEGTGIGLALVRRILDRHNGTITATGEVDKGSAFVFALPNPETKGRAHV